MPPARSGPNPKRRTRGRAGGAWRLFLPFGLFALATLVAALHRALGEPLGPAATAKLADLWQTMAAMLVMYTPVLGYHRRALTADRAEVGPRGRGLSPTGSHPALTIANLPTRKEDASHVNDDDVSRRRTGPR